MKRKGIIIPDKIMGFKFDTPIIVRSISAGGTTNCNGRRKDLDGEIRTKNCTPPLHLVVWGTVRLNSFLYKKKCHSSCKVVVVVVNKDVLCKQCGFIFSIENKPCYKWMNLKVA